jgi:hypothetical protein
MINIRITEIDHPPSQSAVGFGDISGLVQQSDTHIYS